MREALCAGLPPSARRSRQPEKRRTWSGSSGIVARCGPRQAAARWTYCHPSPQPRRRRLPGRFSGGCLDPCLAAAEPRRRR